MTSKRTRAVQSAAHIWIISKGKDADPDLSRIYEGNGTGPVKEYRISDLARYMLDPNPIEVERKLVGCEVHYQPYLYKTKERIRKILPKKLRGPQNGKAIHAEVFMSQCEKKRPPLQDENLEIHFQKIEELLRPYDSTLKRLLTLDPGKISNIMGICEDIGDNRSWLNLQGNVHEKIDFMVNNVSKDVCVILETAHISDGLFDMGGFDFESYDPNQSHRLLKFLEDGRPKCCVLSPNKKVQYWIEDMKLLHFMHLLEQSLQTNPKLQDSFNQCREGRAKPLRLFFNKQIEIDYSKAHLPEIYKEVFESCHMGLNERDVLMNSLNNLQLSISFNYVPQSNSGEEKLFTSISVMHDMRALEPIKDNLPQIYSEIKKRASVSEAGRFYLLDSMRGNTNE